MLDSFWKDRGLTFHGSLLRVLGVLMGILFVLCCFLVFTASGSSFFSMYFLSFAPPVLMVLSGEIYAGLVVPPVVHETIANSTRILSILQGASNQTLKI